jgi:hypothetical protein
MRFASLFLFLPGFLSAQQTGAGVSQSQASSSPTAPAPETKPEDKCSFEGKILSSATEEPVKKSQHPSPAHRPKSGDRRLSYDIQHVERCEREVCDEGH